MMAMMMRMTCRKKMLWRAAAALAALAALTGCSSGPKLPKVDPNTVGAAEDVSAESGNALSVGTQLVPLTPPLLERIGAANLNQVSFFMSKPFKLEREVYSVDKDLTVRNDGSVVRVAHRVTDVIEVPMTDRGALIKYLTTNVGETLYQVLGVEFENMPAMLGFAANLNDPYGRFVLQFDDDQRYLISYTGNDYTAAFDGGERPYLMVRLGANIIEEHSYRLANREWNMPATDSPPPLTGATPGGAGLLQGGTR